MTHSGEVNRHLAKAAASVEYIEVRGMVQGGQPRLQMPAQHVFTQLAFDRVINALFKHVGQAIKTSVFMHGNGPIVCHYRDADLPQGAVPGYVDTGVLFQSMRRLEG